MNRFGQVQKGQWRPSLIALLITLILHVGLFKVVPDELFMKQSADDFSEKAIELTLEQPDAETLQYVEANPEAPENKPDRSDNYSFRDQQAADEDPNDSQKDDMPAVAGEEASRKIVQGSIDQEERIPPESGVYRFSEGSASGQDGSLEPYQATRPVLPTPDFIQQQPEIDEGPGSSPDFKGSGQEFAREAVDSDAPVELYRTGPEGRDGSDSASAADRSAEAKPLPRKRVTLPPDLIQGPLMRSKSSASRRGALAIDATFSQFGEYEQQFYAAVQAGWYQEIDFFQPIDTSAYVVVQFRIHADGTIDEVKVLDSTASEIATLICQTALSKRSPFRPWTVEMIKVFGQKRVMQVKFSYL